MGRKKTYDRNELVAQAVELFRDHGYAGTSTQMLVERLGVNRFSLYAEFGSKQGLFDAVLQRYDREVVERNFGPLERAEAGIDEIRCLLEFFAAASQGSVAGRGCLLCNTAVELGPVDPSGAGLVQRYFARLEGAFLAALTNARRAGALREGVDVKDEARFFTSAVLGLFVMLRAQAPAETIESASRIAARHLQSLCVPGPARPRRAR